MTEAERVLQQAREARSSGDAKQCVALAIRAAGLAEVDEVWEVAYHASACVGRMYLQRGEPLTARGWFMLAQRTAERHHLHRWKGPAIHDLFLCARDSGQPDEALRLAREALDAYGHRHPRLQALGADLAAMRYPPQEWGGYFAPFAGPEARTEDRVPALAGLLAWEVARGKPSRALAWWAELQAAARPDLPGAALAMAHAAESLDRAGMPRQAQEAAERAGAIAASRREFLVAQRAGRVLARFCAPP